MQGTLDIYEDTATSWMPIIDSDKEETIKCTIPDYPWSTIELKIVEYSAENRRGTTIDSLTVRRGRDM